MNKNDTDLAVFMPYLRDYDGMKALKKKLSEVHVPGYASADVAIVLFSVTGEGKYSDIVY